MRKRAPLSLSLATALLASMPAGCASRSLPPIPPASEDEARDARTVDPAARAPRTDGRNLGDPANRAATINAGGPDASSPGGPHPQPGSTAGGTGDTRGLVRSGSPN